jgi:hypothetical protein
MSPAPATSAQGAASAERTEVAPKSPRKRFRFFGPIRRRDQQRFEEAFKKRFTMCGVLNQEIVAYVDRVLDRQINKTNGLLAFDGLLFAALSLQKSESGSLPISIKIGVTSALLAALLLIFLLVVSFGAVDDYDSTASDFEAKCRTIYWRTYLLCVSVISSLTAAICALWQLRWFW